MARLLKEYNEELRPKIQKALNLDNPMEVPKVTKITLNMGVGEAVADKKILNNALKDMEQIAGQKAVKTLARKSVAGFKIRDGYPIGCKVTLRKNRMYEFLDRLVNIAIPRIRDFRGLNAKSFDKQGNYSMGISEQIIFPEINFDQIDAIRGMDITISTTARDAKEGKALLEAFNFPFKSSVTPEAEAAEGKSEQASPETEVKEEVQPEEETVTPEAGAAEEKSEQASPETEVKEEAKKDIDAEKK